MTGAYLRVERNGEWHNIEVEHLTPDELRAKFIERPQEELVNWMIMLCEHLHRIEPLLEDLERDGIIQSISKEEFEEMQTKDAEK
jgi:hypothetical protein